MNTANTKTIALICGGPSLERGISLNSARSAMDHLQGETPTILSSSRKRGSMGLSGDVMDPRFRGDDSYRYDIIPFYVDLDKNFYKLDPAQLYSNTPSDFDFKLAHTAQKLTESETITALKAVDIVFPAMHGNYGETGEFQAFLEYNNIPFVGSSAYTCQNMYYKDRAAAILKQAGFDTIPSCYLKKDHAYNAHLIEDFWIEHKIQRAVVKPVAGGSSIGVHSVTSVQQAFDIVRAAGYDMLIEPFCEGREFTVIVLQSQTGEPVALVPTEIQISYADNQIFDYRRKYLPTCNTVWSCPPNFGDDVIARIRTNAEKIFKLFYMRHFARLDGWLLNNGRIIFTDFNPISGMEQNSFIFLQASRVGMTHRDILSYIVSNALSKYQKESQ